MKKFSVLAFSLLCALSACKKTNTELNPEPNPDPTDKVEMEFKGEISASSKVVDGGFESGDKISVAALVDGEIIADKVYSYGSDVFTSEEPITKESEDDKFAYSAFYPASDGYAGEFEFTVQSDQGAEGRYSISDLLVAEVEATADLKPTLKFKHTLSNVLFDFELSDGSAIVPSSVKIFAEATADCNISKGSYSANGADVVELTPSLYGEDGNRVVVAPQTISKDAVFAEVVYEDESYSVSFDEAMELASGWRYTLRFTIDTESGEVSITQKDASADSWDDENFGDRPDVPDQPDSGEMTLALKEATALDIVVTVGKGTYEGNYYIGLCDVDKYAGTPEAFAEELMDAEINKYGTDLSIVDGIWVHNKPGDVSLDAGWNFFPDGDYIIVAFGIDDFGAITTNVPMIEVHTPAVEVAGSIDVVINSVTNKGISATATPTSEVGNYTFGLLATSTFNDDKYFGGDAVAAAEAVVMALQNAGADLSVANGISVLNGQKTFDFANVWGVEAATDYTLLVFGIDEEGNVNSEVAECETRTADADPLPDVTDDFSATLKNVSTSDIVVTVDKGSYEGNYFVGITDMANYKAQGFTPQTFAEALVRTELEFHTNFDNVDFRWVFYLNGDVSLRMGNFVVPDTEYMVAVFGVNKAGNILTNVATVAATTEHIELAGTIDVEVLDVKADDIIVKATPSAEVGNYFYGICTAKEYDENFGGDALKASQNISYAYRFQGLKPDVADNRYVYNGAAQIAFWGLWYINPSTDYKVMLFGVDEYYMTTSEVSVSSVTTPATNYGSGASFAERSGLIKHFDSYQSEVTLKQRSELRNASIQNEETKAMSLSVSPMTFNKKITK